MGCAIFVSARSFLSYLDQAAVQHLAAMMHEFDAAYLQPQQLRKQQHAINKRSSSRSSSSRVCRCLLGRLSVAAAVESLYCCTPFCDSCAAVLQGAAVVCASVAWARIAAHQITPLAVPRLSLAQRCYTCCKEQ